MSAIATPAVQLLPKSAPKGKAGTPTKSVAKKTTKTKTPPAATTDRRKAEANKDAATKAKNQLRKANAVSIKPQKREYGLDDERAAELKKSKAYNAYREGSSYWCVVEALHSLGIGKLHSGADLIAAYQKVVDKQSFKAFKSKEKRNEENGEDWKGKILTNAYVTTRKDYGQRQRDIGWEVRSEREDGQMFYGLYRLTNWK